MNNLSEFIFYVFDDFLFLFEKNNIFLFENYDEKQNSDIYLFSDFVTFLINYEFMNSEEINFYIDIWKDSFKHVNFEEIKNEFTYGKVLFEKIKENLEIKIHKQNYEIKNIENFALNSLLMPIAGYQKIPKDFDLDNYLRIDKYGSQLYIKQNWGILSNYFVKILSSETIKSIIKFLYPNDKIFLDKNIMTNILNNIRFFNFDTDFIGETNKRFLSINIQSFPPKKNKADKLKKIIYLAVVLITCFHEILGHLFIRIHNYLNKNNYIYSPKPLFGFFYPKKRGKESGENVEVLLFGNYECKMTLNQILFILDLNNYSVSYEEFKNNFWTNGCDTTLESISDELKDLLKLYEIEIDDNDIETKEFYFVGKYYKKEKIIIEIPPQHSMRKLLNKINDE